MRALLFVWEDVLWNINIIFLLTNTHTQLLPHGTTLNEGNRKQVFPKIELSDLANKQDTQFNLTQINDKYCTSIKKVDVVDNIHLFYDISHE